MAIYTDLSPNVDGRDIYTIDNTEVYTLSGYQIDEDAAAIRNSLLNLFLVQQGEVPGRPEFGNPLNIQLFDLYSHISVDTMETSIQNQVAKYEPRIEVIRLNVIKAPEYNRLIVELDYSYRHNYGLNYDKLLLPFAHNTMTYLGGRVKPEPPILGGDC